LSTSDRDGPGKTIEEILAQRSRNMKRLTTALALAAVVVAAGPAYAANDFSWTGNVSSAWNTASNWDGPRGQYPGKVNSDDTVSIDADPNARQPVYSTGTVTVDWIVIDAATNDVSASLLMSGGTLTTSSYMQLIGGDAGSNMATFQYTAGTFSVPEFDMDGGDTVDRVAVLDIDETLNLSSASTDIDADQYSEIDVASTKTFTVDDVTVTAGSALAKMSQSGAGAFTADVFALNGSTSADATAEMEVGSNATFSPTSLVISGGSTEARKALLDFDASVTVAGISGTDTSFAGYCDVDIASDKYFYGKETYLVSGSDVLVSGGGTFQPTTLTVDNATLQVSSATIQTAD
jgi:hypothetical protein